MRFGGWNEKLYYMSNHILETNYKNNERGAMFKEISSGKFFVVIRIHESSNSRIPMNFKLINKKSIMDTSYPN